MTLGMTYDSTSPDFYFCTAYANLNATGDYSKYIRFQCLTEGAGIAIATVQHLDAVPNQGNNGIFIRSGSRPRKLEPGWASVGSRTIGLEEAQLGHGALSRPLTK